MTANNQNHNFAVVPGLNMGLFSPKELAAILEVINRFDVPATKITGAQRLALLGVEPEQMEDILKELKPFIRKTEPNGVTYVQACPGKKWCKFGKADSINLGTKLEQLSFETPLPAKVKVGVASCRMCCTEPLLRDVGFIASNSGWTLVFGGNGGSHPRVADVVAKKLSDTEALDLAVKCLKVYQENARPSLRTARFMERFGIEELKRLVL